MPSSARPVLISAGIGVAIGVLASLADHTTGIGGAVLMGIVSSVATWLTAATVVGAVVSTRRAAAFAAAALMAAATIAYYGLRAVEFAPMWAENGGQGRFFVIAGVWLVGTAVGGAVVGYVAHFATGWLRRRIWVLGIWIGVCVAPAMAYLPDQIVRASSSVPDLTGSAGSSAVLILVSTIAGAVATTVALLWVHRRAVARVGRVGVVLGVAALTATALAGVFRVATDLFTSLVHA